MLATYASDTYRHKIKPRTISIGVVKCEDARECKEDV